MSKLTYLLGELRRLTKLMHESEERYVEKIESEGRKRNYIDQKVLPVIDEDTEQQWQVVTNEVERLLESKDERCKRDEKRS